MDKETRDNATRVAREQGFSSLQEVMRLFARKFSEKQINVSFEQFPSVQLSKKAVARYNKMSEDARSGRAATMAFDNVDDLMKELASED
jgi:hypothetical protein